MESSNEKTAKSLTMPLITAGLLVGVGIAAFFWFRSRSSDKPTAVDDLLHLCENFADSLEQSLGDNGKSSLAS